MKKFVIEYVDTDKSVFPSCGTEHITEAIEAFELAYENASLIALESRPASVRLVNTLNGHTLVNRKLT